jgi:predicted NAD/FAD-binding protein
VDEGDRQVPVDTGFIVYSRKYYLNLTALFDVLGVETRRAA